MEKQCLTAEIINNKTYKEFDYSEIIVLTTTIENFKITTLNAIANFLINRSLIRQSNSFSLYNARELYPQAIQNYNYAMQNNYPFNAFEAYMKYILSYNKNCLLSYYYDTYNFTGGAHGNTIRLSDTFSLVTGKMIPLSAYFKSMTYYRAKIINLILAQAVQNYTNDNNLYFDNYKDLIVQYFNPRSYYLSEYGLVIYYGQYEIGPYVSGIVEFTIPYNELDFPPTCEIWC